jgi:hypothetical protein
VPCKNDDGEVKKKFEVFVLEIPRFLHALSDVTVLENEFKVVEIAVAGYPKPEVFWTFNGKRIQEGDNIKLDSLMEPGVYSCVAENSEGQAESKFNFKVAFPPNMLIGFDETQKLKNVQKGEVFELLCPFENFDDIAWEQNSLLIDDQKNEKLKNSKIDEHSTVEYKCTASNSIGNKSFSYKVNILKAPTITVSNPKGSLIVGIQDLTLDKKLELKCKAEGNPTPNIQWSKSGVELAHGMTFKIEKVTYNDAGHYTCTAVNSQGTAERVVEVKVSSKPYIEDGIKMVKVDSIFGDDVTIECKIDSLPKPNFSWTKDG